MNGEESAWLLMICQNAKETLTKTIIIVFVNVILITLVQFNYIMHAQSQHSNFTNKHVHMVYA